MSLRFGFRLRPGFSTLFSIAQKTTSATPTDPIQKAFVQKLQEYAKKAKLVLLLSLSLVGLVKWASQMPRQTS